MAIKAYTGIMGAGKTYEVASVVILNALRDGRRVISNIAGLNQSEYEKILIGEGVASEKIGQIISVPHAAVLEPDFWLTDSGLTVDKLEVIKAGDLVVLDEIWRFWDGFSLRDSNGNKRPDCVMNFFRMHRQFVNVITGITCDVALITQDIADLHRSVKSVVEETYRMSKLTSIGMANRYRVDVFYRTKIVKEPLQSFQRTYDSKYFNLYQSHSQKKEGSANPKEVNIDKRGNILTGKLFILVLPILLIVGLYGLYFVWGFFHPKPKDTESKTSQTTTTNNQTQNANPTTNQPQKSQQTSSTWHLHGKFKKNELTVYVVSNDEGAYRYVTNPNFSYTVLDEKINVDGEVVNNWLKPKQSNDNNQIINHAN